MSDLPRAPLVAVKLTPVGRAQSFLLGDQARPMPGDRVVVQTDAGPAVGTVVRSIPQLDEKRRPVGDVPPRVVRLATRDDIVARAQASASGVGSVPHRHAEECASAALG